MKTKYIVATLILSTAAWAGDSDEERRSEYFEDEIPIAYHHRNQEQEVSQSDEDERWIRRRGLEEEEKDEHFNQHVSQGHSDEGSDDPSSS